MAIDPNVFYRAGAIKGQLARQAKQDRQQSFSRAMSGISSVTKMIGAKQDQYDKNMSDFNGEIPREVVPEAAMMDLTRHIAREKAVYTANAKIMRSSFSRKKKREAAEENEKIKSGLAQVYADFQTANDMGKTAEKTVPYIGDGVDLNEKDNILDFANNKWYERGVKFTRDGMTINGVREEQVLDDAGNPLPQSKLVNYDQRLSDIRFPKAVKGTGGSLVRKNADIARQTSLKGTQIDDAAFDVMKQEYVQQLKNMPVEEQRHLYFNGLGGFEGSSQAETDAAKAMGLDADGFKNMKALINEDDPNYDAVMKQREEFDKQMNILTTRKDFLTPEMVDNQWSTVKAAYQSGMDEYNRQTQVKKDDRAEQRALNEASRNRTNKNKPGKGSGKVNLGKDRFGVNIGYAFPADMKRKSDEIDNANKIGDEINHLTNDSIYAKIVGGGGDSPDDPRGIGEIKFEIYVDGEKREGLYTKDRVKMMFKVDDLEMGTDETNMG
tara:strand:- start:1103 stop:2587 length:1485 start_codon:yes stop_codon:yes gene_type:complete